MSEKDDELGLSLSLRCPEINHNHPPPPPTAATASTFPFNLFRSAPLPFMQQQAQSSDRNYNVEARSLFRGIDMNRAATVIDCDGDDDGGVTAAAASPNTSTVSSLSAGKRMSHERDENDGGESLEMEEDDDGGGGGEAARKKLRLSKEQAAMLEETFKEHNTLNPKQKVALAKQLNLRPRQVEVWFQNRRARTKLKQTEVDCEYLRRCCENLTDENRRLQKEVTELRALKLSPQFYMNMSPPTTLTMCPQCERVATTPGPTNRQPAHHHRPTPVNPWAAIIPPQQLDPHRPRT